MRRAAVAAICVAVMAAVGSAAARSDAIDPQALVETIRAVKADRMASLLQDEFFKRERSMRTE